MAGEQGAYEMFPTGTIVHGFATTQELEEKLAPLKTMLTAANFQVADLTANQVNGMGITVDYFVKNTRNVASLPSAANLRDIWRTYSRTVDCPLHDETTLKDILTFARWLKTEAGQNVMRSVRQKRKLESRATAQLTADDIAWSTVFNTMLSDYSADVKNVRTDLDAQIVEHQRAIRKLEVRKENELTNISEVRQKAIAQYCSDPNVQDVLRVYLQEKVLHLQEQGYTKQAWTFRNLYATVGGREVIPDAVVQEEASDEDDASGLAPQTGGEVVTAEAGAGGQPKGNRQATTRGLQIRSTILTRLLKLRTAEQSTSQQRPDPSPVPRGIRRRTG